MDKIDSYLQSPEFWLMVDIFLYQAAVEEVNRYFAEIQDLSNGQSRPVKRNQVKGLQAVSQEQNLNQAKSMAKNQLTKARKRLKDPKTDHSTDTLFWSTVSNVIDNNTPGRFSLSLKASEVLGSKGLLPESKKERQAAIDRVSQTLSTVFFEHFCCHYYYLVSGQSAK